MLGNFQANDLKIAVIIVSSAIYKNSLSLGHKLIIIGHLICNAIIAINALCYTAQAHLRLSIYDIHIGAQWSNSSLKVTKIDNVSGTTLLH